MGYHESYAVPEILGTDDTNDTSERPKKRYKDYKRIITMKTLDTSVYREGLPYLVKFNGDPKGEGIGNCDVAICIEATGDNLTFVFVRGGIDEEYTHKAVSISCEYLDKSKIEIIPYWSDTAVLKLIDSVKHNPDNFHGYKYWNEELQIFDQDNVEKEKLNENFTIIIDGDPYPLLIPKTDNTEQYDFNMDALQILEDRDSTCLFHIKRKHLDKWETYGDFKIKVLHNPDGFQLFHNLKSDDKNMVLLKDTWYPGDILSYVKGLQLETLTLINDDAEDASDGKGSHDAFWDDFAKCNSQKELQNLYKNDTKDIETEPDMKNFYINDQNKIIDPNVSAKYPLFVRDDHSNDRWIINYNVLCKALVREDVILDISFKMKDCRAQAYCSYNAEDVQVHVGGSVLTGKRPSKDVDTFIEFEAGDWKEMVFAHVNLRRK